MNHSDTPTFENIIETNKTSIYKICNVYAVSPISPEDLFQEVVYQIWKSFATYNRQAKISTWIYRIALNVCMRYKLKLDKHNSNTSRLSGINIIPAPATTNESQQSKFVALKECMQILKEGDRSILVLYLEGLAYKEMSEITGLTENHVAVKMKRIRKSLFECISPKLK